MVATWASDSPVGATILITLVNAGKRTLTFDTGLHGYPMADFAFSLELPTHEWLSVNCQTCVPGSMAQPVPYTVQLRPAQFLRFTLPLSTLVGTDPRSGTAMNLCGLEGQILVELQVPTPPNAAHTWPGYVSATLPLLRQSC